MINLTSSAKNYLTDTTKKHNKKYAYLGVLGGGCSGFQYEWDMTDDTEKGTLIEDILVLDKLAEMLKEVEYLQLIKDDSEKAAATAETFNIHRCQFLWGDYRCQINGRNQRPHRHRYF